MTQKIKILGLVSGAGIVVVLFAMGVFLILAKISSTFGYLAVGASVFIGIIYGILGIFGILRRYM